PGDIVRPFVREEITEEIAAAARNDGEPATGVRREFVPLEGSDAIGDEAGDRHGSIVRRGCVGMVRCGPNHGGRHRRTIKAMKDGPSIVGLAALIGDRARARMLTALLGGQALTATELTEIADITKQTASAHLARLVAGGLLALEKQGRHRYFRLADDDVAELLESLLGVAY